MGAFIAEMVKDHAMLQDLIKTGREGLAEHVHAMRGKCAMFGEDILYRLLTDFEAGATDRMAAIADRVAELRALGQGDG